MIDAADVDRGPEAGHLRLEGVEVDLDLRDVAGPAVGRVGVARVGRVVPDDAGRRLVLDEGRRALGVGGEALPRVARERPVRLRLLVDPRAQLGRGLDGDRPDDHDRPRGDGRPRVGDVLRRRDGEVDGVDRDAEGVGRDLPEDGLGPLADVGRGGPHAGAPAGEEVDGDLPLQVLLARAGEAGAVEEDGGADAARDAPRHDRARGRASRRSRSPPSPSRRTPATPTDSFSVCPVAVVSPRRRRFFRRSSSGSIPSVRATRSMCRSIAQIVCGAPKPRKAPFGGVFVATASASTRHVLPAVGAAGVERAAREDDRRERDVRAAVDEDADRDGAQRPVPVAAARDLDARRVPLRRGLDVLLAAVDQLHGAARLLREEEGVEGDERRVLLLAAEAAAGDGLRHVDAVVGEAEDPLDPLLDVVGALERALDVRALVVPEGDHPVRLDVDVLLGARFVDAADDDLAPLDRRPPPRPFVMR